MVLSLCLLKNWTEKLCLLLILFFTTSFPLLLLTFPFTSLILFLYPHCKVCQRQHPCNSCLCSFLLRNFTCFFSSSFLLDVYETQLHSGKPTLLPELQLLIPSCLKSNHVSHQFPGLKTWVFPLPSSIQCQWVLPILLVISSVLFSPCPWNLFHLDIVPLHLKHCSVIRIIFSGHFAHRWQVNSYVITFLLCSELFRQLCTFLREKSQNMGHLSSKAFHFQGCIAFCELLLQPRLPHALLIFPTSSCLLIILSSPAHLHIWLFLLWDPTQTPSIILKWFLSPLTSWSSECFHFSIIYCLVTTLLFRELRFLTLYCYYTTLILHKLDVLWT